MSKVVFLFTVLALSLACGGGAGGGAGGAVGGANSLLSGIQINTVSQQSQQTAQQARVLAQDATSTKGKLVNMDITDAQTVYIARETTIGGSLKNTVYKVSNGTASTVTYLDANNVTVPETFEPQAVYDINSTYFMACYGPISNPTNNQADTSEKYIVEKATGKMYIMSQDKTGFPQANHTGYGVRSDKNIQVYGNRMYYLTVAEHNGVSTGYVIVGADLIPNYFTEFIVSPTNLTANRFVMDQQGDILYTQAQAYPTQVCRVIKNDNTVLSPTYTDDYWTDASGNLIHVAAGGNMTTLDVSGTSIQHSTSTMIPGFSSIMGRDGSWVYNISGNTYVFTNLNGGRDTQAWAISGNTVRTITLGLCDLTNIEPGTDCYYFSTTTAIYKVSTSNDVVTPLTTVGLYDTYKMSVVGTKLTVAVTASAGTVNYLLTFVNDVLTTTTPLNDKKVVSVLTIR